MGDVAEALVHWVRKSLERRDLIDQNSRYREKLGHKMTHDHNTLRNDLMKKTILPLAIAAALPMSALADVTIYGKGSVSFQSVDEGKGSFTQLKSNDSRIGLMGKEKLNDSLTAIYKFEYQTDVASGDNGDNNKTFTQRNIYVGLEGGFGQVIAGMFDTPLNTAQKKVDLFSDLEGDIGSLITNSDIRVEQSVQYSTGKLLGPFVAKIDYLAEGKEDGVDGFSTSIAYDSKYFYAAAAYNQDVESKDVYRLVGQAKFGPVQIGALYEEEEDNDNGTENDGWVASAKWSVTKDFALKAQYGESDIKYTDGETYSLGADYQLSKNTKIFAYYTAEEYTKEATGREDNTYGGVGLEIKF